MLVDPGSCTVVLTTGDELCHHVPVLLVAVMLVVVLVVTATCSDL